MSDREEFGQHITGGRYCQWVEDDDDEVRVHWQWQAYVLGDSGTCVTALCHKPQSA